MKAAAYTVTTEELLSLAPNSYVLYDVRGEAAYSYGSIPGALNCPAILSAADRGDLPCDKQLILFSEHGKTGESLTQALREKGLDTYNLKDGYEGWLRYYCNGEERAREVEQSLTKRRRFKEKIFHRFTKAIVEFDMIQPGDKIAVCISGGKDSMLMAKLFQELKRHDKFPLNWCSW